MSKPGSRAAAAASFHSMRREQQLQGQDVSDVLETQVAGVSNFERLLDSEEAAPLLGIHPKTLQKMARKEEIPAHRIGRGWRFRASELDEWLQTRCHSCRN